MNKEMKNLILYGLGRAVSSFGSIIYSFAIGLYVLNTTGSGMKFAVTLLVAFLPSLILTPFAGVLADKFDKKKIVVRMDLLNGLLFVLFYFYISVLNSTIKLHRTSKLLLLRTNLRQIPRHFVYVIIDQYNV